MKNMKKILALIVACALMLCIFVACGNEDETQKTTTKPTETPTQKPDAEPTEAPTQKPTEAPTNAPTEAPTEDPTEDPTEGPTEDPTEGPTEDPTEDYLFEDVNDAVYVMATTGAANLRTEPSFYENTVAMSLRNGVELERIAIGTNNNWNKVVYEGQEYFISERVIIEKSVLDGFEELSRTIKIKTEVLNVRFAPGRTSDDPITEFVKDEEVEVVAFNPNLGEQGWYKVKLTVSEEQPYEFGYISAHSDYSKVVEKVTTAVREAVDKMLNDANAFIWESPYYSITNTLITVFNDPETSESTASEDVVYMVFTPNAFVGEMLDENGNPDNIIIVNGTAYNHSVGEDGKDIKEKWAVSQEELSQYMLMMKTDIYMGEAFECESIKEIVNTDGSVTYVLSGVEIAELGDSEVSYTLDAQGRFVRCTAVVITNIEGIDMMMTSDMIFEYYEEGELEITAPEDADEYEEYIEEEWSCDCGASSWEDCICEFEWSCDCGASTWEDCVCGLDLYCTCGATRWGDCVCE